MNQDMVSPSKHSTILCTNWVMCYINDRSSHGGIFYCLSPDSFLCIHQQLLIDVFNFLLVPCFGIWIFEHSIAGGCYLPYIHLSLYLLGYLNFHLLSNFIDLKCVLPVLIQLLAMFLINLHMVCHCLSFIMSFICSLKLVSCIWMCILFLAQSDNHSHLLNVGSHRLVVVKMKVY